MLCGSDKYVFSSSVVQLNPSTQHTAMVHTMHTGASTQNVYFLLVECSELVVFAQKDTKNSNMTHSHTTHEHLTHW